MAQNNANASARNTKEPLPVQAAKASLWLFVLLLGVGGIEQFANSGDSGTGVTKQAVSTIWGLVALGLSLTGFVLGILALFGIQKYGAKKILLRAVLGICFNGLILLAAGCVFIFAIARMRPKVLVDHSLTTKGYEIDGIPALDHVWEGKDYEKTASVLSTLGENDPNMLPRWKSAASSEVFSRLVSDSNLEELRDKETQAVSRLQREAAVAVKVASIEKVYSDTVKGGSIYDDEMVEFTRFGLQLSVDIDGDMDDITGMMSADNPNREAIVHQFEAGRRGLTEEIDGGIAILESGKPSQIMSLTRLAGYEADFIPKLLGHMPKERVQSWIDRVKAVAGRETDSGYVSALNHLATEMEHRIL